MQELFHPTMRSTELSAISALGLAHMGDCVFELLVRTRLCLSGVAKSEHLHRITVEHVSAPAQAVFADAILPSLSEQELAVYRRGRLLGSLYLSGQLDRIEELFSIGWEAQNAL